MHKSGTSLLRDTILSIPGFAGPSHELHLFSAIGRQVDYSLRREGERCVNQVEALDRILLDAILGRLNDDRTGGGVATLEDINRLSRLTAGKRPATLDWLVAELGRAYLESGSWCFVEKSVEHVEFANELVSHKDISVIHITRHPVAVLHAVRRAARRHRRLGQYTVLPRALKTLHRQERIAGELRSTHLPNYAQLTYESFVAEPLATLDRTLRYLFGDETVPSAAIARAIDEIRTNNSTVSSGEIGLRRDRVHAWTSEATRTEKILCRLSCPSTNNYEDRRC